LDGHGLSSDGALQPGDHCESRDDIQMVHIIEERSRIHPFGWWLRGGCCEFGLPQFSSSGLAGFTWVYTTSYSSTDRAAIWDAIRSGRVSTSDQKDLGYFTINGAVQGSVLNVIHGSSLQLELVQFPVTERKCTRIMVFNKNQEVVYTVTNPPTSVTYWNTRAPSTDDFYVVKFEFTKMDGSGLSEVWANPVFINVQ
jgi:hypothetical protein